jgi:hypothetical protein
MSESTAQPTDDEIEQDLVAALAPWLACKVPEDSGIDWYASGLRLRNALDHLEEEQRLVVIAGVLYMVLLDRRPS